MKLKDYILLAIIVICGFMLRIYTIDWDSGFHMHPDERAIVLFTLPLQFSTNLQTFLSPQSSWNPHFFAYGSFPLYLLHIVSVVAGVFDKSLMEYQRINILGRIISAVFDSATILVLFCLAKKIANKYVGFLAAFFYAISVLAIQTSHFYAVDTTLTFFISMTLLLLLSFYTKPSLKKASSIGIFFGLSLATKTSAIAVSIPIVLTLVGEFILLFLKQPHKAKVWFPHIPHVIKTLLTNGITIFLSTAVVFFICEPYALIDFSNFTMQNLQQYAMTHDAFTFPYTLQYVGKIPYVYELKNIFLWGQGPLLAVICFAGALFVTFTAAKKEITKRTDIFSKEIILLLFFWLYIGIVGKFAIGFMRYMLPIYPLLALFGGILVFRIGEYIRNTFFNRMYYLVILFSLCIWPLSFMGIYTHLNTRIQATNWIMEHIPAGKTLAIEHWDDSLPLFGQERYTMQTLELYNPESPEKWQKINAQLAQTDYIIIASNRLYIPLQKLTNCAQLPAYRCYTESANYYKNLFSGKLGFTKVAEFIVSPQVPLTSTPIDDQGADESFTVYDHPKIMIFAKTP